MIQRTTTDMLEDLLDNLGEYTEEDLREILPLNLRDTNGRATSEDSKFRSET